MTQKLKYKNIQISFSDVGKGSVVVLLHGFLENSSMWNSIIPELSKKNRVITIDLLGHGKTACIGYVHTMEAQALMVKEVLKSLKLRRYILIGHSMGGYVALEFARLFPKSIKGLCLMNSTYEKDSEERMNLRTRAINMAPTNYENLVRMSFTNLFAENSKNKYQSELKRALKEALKTPIQGFIAGHEGMRIRKDYTSFFKKSIFKKLIILGKKDTVIEYNSMIDFTSKNNISTISLSEGHMSHIENPNELLIALKKFVCKS